MTRAPDLQSIDVKDAASTILDVAERLSALLVELEGEPIDPDRLTIDLLPHTPAFAAFIKPDPRRNGCAMLELSPRVVTDVVEAVRSVGWNFVEEHERAGETPLVRTDTALEPIAELAIQWIMLHELAHWMLGHLGYHAEVTGLTDARLSCVDNDFAVADPSVSAAAKAARGRDLDAKDYRCLELEADLAATVLLDILHEDLEEEAGEPAPALPDAMKLPASRQLVVLAAGVAILLVQRQRGSRCAGASSPRHPSPEARALNVMRAMVGWNARHLGYADGDLLRFPLHSDEQIAQVGAAWVDALRVFYRYLSPLAEVIGVEPIFSRSTLVPAELPETPDHMIPLTARDLLTLLLHPDSPPERLRTLGAKELAELRAHGAELKTKTTPYAFFP